MTVLALALAAILAAPPPAAVAGDRLDAVVRRLFGDRIPAGFAAANGRLEAEEIEIATKLAGRLAEVTIAEGDLVEAGRVVARLEATDLRAQLAAAEAQARRAEQSVALADAVIAQRDSEKTLAAQELARVEALFAKGFASGEMLDQRRAARGVAEAAAAAALAGRADAAAAVDAARADVARIRSLLADTEIVAPRRGRIEYRLARGGEVVGAGARIATLLDLTDVYMTVFVPAAVAGKLKLGDEARLILDPIPDYVVPARIAFVASEAQFTPKTVETKAEREKLMFRVKLTLPPALLAKYEPMVKTGVRGMAYVRVDAARPWPEGLAVRLPK